jgi:curved DNA-binding protein CbpA
MENHYHNLFISSDATSSQIKDAHRKLIAVCHPDKNEKTVEKTAEEMFKRVQNSYEILSNPVTKALHDKEIKNYENILLRAKKVAQANKVFLLTYETTIVDGFTNKILELHKALNADKNIIWWFLYIEGSYVVIVKNNVSTQYLSNLFTRIVPKKIHLAIQADTAYYNGFLNQDVIKYFHQVENFNVA